MSRLFLSSLLCFFAIAASWYLRHHSQNPSLRLNHTSPSAFGPFHTTCLQPFHHHPPSSHPQLLPFHPYLSRPGAASLQGRRSYQEDRLFCAPRIRLPSPDGNWSRPRDAGLFGVFDGHLGDDASEFAAVSIQERFLHHVSRLFGTIESRKRISPDAEQSNELGYGSACRSNSSDLGVPCGGELLEEALRQAISDIDSTFHEEATRRSLQSGSTACIALHVDGQILVANVGDSKALICSSCTESSYKGNSVDNKMNGRQHRMRSTKSRNQMMKKNWKAALRGGLCAQELSHDHRPDRPDEKVRIEAFGGVVTSGSLSRVNGQLAVSRSIGDFDFKRYGVTSDPELSSWQNVSKNDMFLVLASDGIFERMSPQDVCNLLHSVQVGQDMSAVMNGLKEDSSLAALPLPGLALAESESRKISHKSDGPSSMPSSHMTNIDACFMEGTAKLEPWSAEFLATAFLRGATGIAQVMAQVVVEVAYRAGSTDNLSALVIPLKQLVSDFS